MKNPKMTTVWWATLFIIECISLVVFCIIMDKSAGVLVWVAVIYFILSCIVFWGISLGTLGYLLQKKNEPLAERLYEIATKNKYTSSYALLSYGLLLLKRGDNDTSIKMFDRVLAKKGQNSYVYKTALINKSLCYWSKGNIDEAINSVNEAIERFSYINASTYASLGYFYILKNDYEKALEYSNKAIDEDKNNASAWDNLGQIYYRQEDYEMAEENFKKAISIKADLVDSLFYLGLICEKKDDISNAKEYFNKANRASINSFNTVTEEQVKQKFFEYNK